MTQEKILAFLNMDLDTPIDKDFMKGLFWFGFCCAIPLFGFGCLIKAFPKNTFDLIFIIISVLLFVVLGIWLKIAKNPAHAHSFSFSVSTLSFLDVGFCAIKYSFLESSPFGIWHALLMVFFASLGIMINFRKQYGFKYLSSHSIEETEDMIHKKWGKRMVFIPVSITASLAFPLSRILSKNIDSGMGFPIWGIASAFLFFVITTAYNYVISKKYKLAKIFEE